MSGTGSRLGHPTSSLVPTLLAAAPALFKGPPPTGTSVLYLSCPVLSLLLSYPLSAARSPMQSDTNGGSVCKGPPPRASQWLCLCVCTVGMHSRMHACPLAGLHAPMHAYMHALNHMHTCIRACMHTCMHTSTHAGIHAHVRTHEKQTRVHTTRCTRNQPACPLNLSKTLLTYTAVLNRVITVGGFHGARPVSAAAHPRP
jgi:hypothetical protein